MKSLDDDIRDTLEAAAGGAVPDGYYEGLADHIAGALEVHEMQGGKMNTGTNGAKSGDLPPDMLSRTGEAADDDSGLIDIKNMARSTKRRVTQRMSTESDVEESLLASSRPSALRDVVLPEPGKEAPVMALGSTVSAISDVAMAADAEAPVEDKKKSGLWIALAAAVLLIGGGAAAYMNLQGGADSASQSAAVAVNETPTPAVQDNGGDEPPAVAADPIGEPGGIVADTPEDSDDGEDATDADGSEDPVETVTAERGAKTAAKTDSPKASTSSKSSKSATKSKDTPKKDTAKDEPKAKTDDAVAKKSDSKEPDFEALLDGATGGAHAPKGGAVKAEPEDDAPKKAKLTRTDIKKGMASVRGRVAGCYEQFKVPGTVSVKVKISNTGVVTSATATGKFAGTDTGACVAKAVTAASFPEFGGAPMSFSYPFLLQ